MLPADSRKESLSALKPHQRSWPHRRISHRIRTWFITDAECSIFVDGRSRHLTRGCEKVIRVGMLLREGAQSIIKTYPSLIHVPVKRMVVAHLELLVRYKNLSSPKKVFIYALQVFFEPT